VARGRQKIPLPPAYLRCSLKFDHFFKAYSPRKSWRKLLLDFWLEMTKKDPSSYRANSRPMSWSERRGFTLPTRRHARAGQKGRSDNTGWGHYYRCGFGSGPLTALVNTIGSYFARDSRTEVEIQTVDGRKIRISSRGFKREEF
jgi:hypothetical protein